MRGMKKASSIQVLDRAIHLLDLLAGHPDGATLKVLSADSGLHPSTAFRILGALVAHNMVKRDEGGRYRLGHHLLRYAGHVHGNVDLRAIAQPLMQTLCDETGETVNLTVREGNEVVYVERVMPKRMMRVELVVGSRAPLHVTAVGKLMLAEGDEKSCRDYARRSGLKRYTANTITKVDALLTEIAAAKLKGYALDNEEAETGVGCIGALIRDASGLAVGGLSISAPLDRRREEWIPLLRDAAQRLSAKMGYAG